MRASMPLRPPAVARSAMRVPLVGNSRDCSRASRSGGATKITVSLIGDARIGFSAGGVTPVRRDGLIVPVVERSPVSAEVRCSKGRLPLKEAVEFFLELLLVEQLAAHDAVDLRAQFGDAIFVSKLHFGLSADQAGEDIVTKCEVGAGRDRPDGHDDQSADHDPESDRSDADLMSGMRERVAVVSTVQMS